MPFNETQNYNAEYQKPAASASQAAAGKARIGLKQLLSAQLSNSIIREGKRDHSASDSTSVCSSTHEDQSLVLSRSVCN